MEDDHFETKKGLCIRTNGVGTDALLVTIERLVASETKPIYAHFNLDQVVALHGVLQENGFRFRGVKQSKNLVTLSTGEPETPILPRIEGKPSRASHRSYGVERALVDPADILRGYSRFQLDDIE